MVETTPALVMRVFTRGLRIPTLIGKLQGGVRIWGGPYTSTQVYGAIAIVVAGFIYGDLVLPFGWFGNRTTVLVTAAGVGYLLGLVRVGGRDPVSAALALIGVMSGPGVGRCYGRVVRLPRPGRARQRIQLLADRAPAPEVLAAPVNAASPDAAAVPDTAAGAARSAPTDVSPAAAGRVLSGLERQLAMSTAVPSSRS